MAERGWRSSRGRRAASGGSCRPCPRSRRGSACPGTRRRIFAPSTRRPASSRISALQHAPPGGRRCRAGTARAGTRSSVAQQAARARCARERAVGRQARAEVDAVAGVLGIADRRRQRVGLDQRRQRCRDPRTRRSPRGARRSGRRARRWAHCGVGRARLLVARAAAGAAVATASAKPSTAAAVDARGAPARVFGGRLVKRRSV